MNHEVQAASFLRHERAMPPRRRSRQAPREVCTRTLLGRVVPFPTRLVAVIGLLLCAAAGCGSGLDDAADPKGDDPTESQSPPDAETTLEPHPLLVELRMHTDELRLCERMFNGLRLAMMERGTEPSMVPPNPDGTEVQQLQAEWDGFNERWALARDAAHDADPFTRLPPPSDETYEIYHAAAELADACVLPFERRDALSGELKIAGDALRGNLRAEREAWVLLTSRALPADEEYVRATFGLASREFEAGLVRDARERFRVLLDLARQQEPFGLSPTYRDSLQLVINEMDRLNAEFDIERAGHAAFPQDIRYQRRDLVSGLKRRCIAELSRFEESDPPPP